MTIRDWITERRQICHLEEINCEVKKWGKRGGRKKDKGEYKDKKKGTLVSESYTKLTAREEGKTTEKGSKTK